MTAVPRRGFDEFAQDYEHHAATGPHNALYDRPAVLDALGDVTGLRVFDAGCGPGLYAQELLDRGADVTGVDGSPEMIRLARARTNARARLVVHDLAHPLDWIPSGTFDVAIMALVIHHLDDRTAALRELHRVLRRGGRLVVSTHHPTSDWQRLGGSYFDVELVEETWKGDWCVRYWRQPLDRSCGEFADAGFLIERVIEPRPTQELEERFPDEYEELSGAPGFIVFSLVKP